MNLFLACRPFHRNWQISPDPGSEFKFHDVKHDPISDHVALQIAASQLYRVSLL